MPAVHGTWGLEHPWGLKGGGTKRHMPSAAIALTPTGAPRGWVLEGGPDTRPLASYFIGDLPGRSGPPGPAKDPRGSLRMSLPRAWRP
jgi:hypothetical protein